MKIDVSVVLMLPHSTYNKQQQQQQKNSVGRSVCSYVCADLLSICEQHFKRGIPWNPWNPPLPWNAENLIGY